MKPCCVLASHFLTPPGLDPWTGLRHDYSSTEDFSEQWTRWNKACFGANSASRILTPEGKIADIVNNYRFLSFSFSCQLLDELKRDSPNVYRRIKQADRESLQQRRHGNALARPWVETALPLLKTQDAATLIDWGLASFREHFEREAEGFCLPHNAVNTGILDLLIDRGIRFLLLSASQAEGTMVPGSGSWQRVDGPLSHRPYSLLRPSGTIAVFFSDANLEAGLHSGLLKDSANLEEALHEAAREAGFVNVSAHGETFGVLEPFGDMCLASVWSRLSPPHSVECVNFGQALDLFSPELVVKLKKGDDELGSSAECPHGVARWQRECGCRSSSRSQLWKRPLRMIVSSSAESLQNVIQEEALSLGVTLAQLKQAIPGLLLRQQSPRRWATTITGSSDHSVQDRIIAAAWYLAWSYTMYSSDLWGADDPLDPSARHVLLSSLRALEIQNDALLPAFLHDLESITVNGGIVLGSWVKEKLLKRRHDARFSAARFLLDRLLRPQARYEDSLGSLTIVDFSRSKHEIDAEVFRYTGNIAICDSSTELMSNFDYLLLEDHREGVSLYLKDADEAGRPMAFDLETLPLGDRNEIMQLMGSDLEISLASESKAIFPLLRKSLVYARLLDVAPVPIARSLMELAVTRKILELTEETVLPDAELFSTLEEELGFAQDFSLRLDTERLTRRFSRWMTQALSHREDFSSETVVKTVETLLGAFTRWKFQPDLTVAQSLVFEFIQERTPALIEALKTGRIEALKEIKRLIRLGNLLWIDTSKIENQILEGTSAVSETPKHGLQ